MPIPEKTTRSETQYISIDVLLDTLCVRFGYRDRDSIHIRLEEDGSVYLCDSRESRKFGEPQMISGPVSWELFAREWPGFVRYMLAKNHDAAAEAAEGK